MFLDERRLRVQHFADKTVKAQLEWFLKIYIFVTFIFVLRCLLAFVIVLRYVNWNGWLDILYRVLVGSIYQINTCDSLNACGSKRIKRA